MTAIALSGVSASYPVEPGGLGALSDSSGPKGPEVPELRLCDLDLELGRGELCALLGANGAGKSTLVRVVAGSLAPSKGTVTLLGRPAGEMSREQRARCIALVPQRTEVSMGFSVLEVACMGRAPHQGRMMRMRDEDEAAVAHALEACGLSDLARRRVDALSGGEQKRVHIARALAQRAPILLLDEAGAHLDIKSASTLYGVVRDEVRNRGLTCLMAMHDLDAAARHADRVVLLKNGRLLADGTVAEVMREDVLREAFDVDVEVGVTEQGRRYFAPR